MAPPCNNIRPIPNFSAIGTAVWICPPPSQLAAHIRHYIKCKEGAPQSLSACIHVLPCTSGMLQPDYMALLHHMQIVREYPTGTHLFSCATVPMRGIPCPVRIYYDPIVLPPPPPILHCAAGLIRAASVLCDPPPSPMLQPPLMLMPLTCNGVPGVALADSGASHVYVTADFAHRTKADIKRCPHLSVHLADSDTMVPIGGMCKIKITLHRKQSVWVTAFVLPNLVHGVSLILGESWLKQHKVALDYGKMKCVVRLPKGKLEISPLPPVIFNVKSSVAAALSSAHAPICTARQAIRMINRGAKPFILLVREQPARGARLSEASLPRPGFPHLCA